MKFKVKYFDGPGCKWEEKLQLPTDTELDFDGVIKWIPFVMGHGLNVMLFQPNPGEFLFWIDEKRFQQR